MKILIAIVLTYFSFTDVKADQLRVAITDVPPFSYVENNKFKGFHVDILKQIEHDSSLQFKYELYPHARITTYLDNANPDLFILTRVICEKSKKYEIQDILYRIRPAILIRQSVYDKKRNDYRIGRLLGTCTDLFKKYVPDKLGVDVPTMDQAAEMLKTNRLDGICGISQVINFALERKGFKEKFVAYKLHPDSPLFDAVICRKRSLSSQIKKKLELGSKDIKIPDVLK